MRRSFSTQDPGPVPVSDFFERNQIQISEPSAEPFLSFNHPLVPQYLQKVLEKENIVEPTLIQSATMSVALQKRDIVGIAETGSGKTLAYLLPSIPIIN